MMSSTRRFGTMARTMIAAAALVPWLAACASGGDPDALSGSSQYTPFAGSTTADYGNDGVSEPGTDWGRADAFHTQCRGACGTMAGGS